MPFQRLATVELQLIMHCCDKRTLLSLARCSRFTLQAASDDFAWRFLSPLELALIHPPLPDTGVWQRLRRWIRPPPPPPQPLAQRLSASLLRFCDISIRWNSDFTHFRFSPVSADQLDALAAIPRLSALDFYSHWAIDPAHIASLVRRPGLRDLTALVCHGRHLDEASITALAECCPRLSTVTIGLSARTDAPLHLLPALTDLTAPVSHSRGLTMASVARCAGLRRLTITRTRCTSRDLHTALLSPTLRTLEHLAVNDANAFHADGGDQPPARLDWAAAFANLHALRSLHLEHPRGMDELLAAISAGCAQLHSLSLSSRQVGFDETIGVAVTLPSVAVVSALLVRRPSLRSVTLILPTRHRFMFTRSSMGRDAKKGVWLRTFEDLNALAALHHQRLTVRFDCD